MHNVNQNETAYKCMGQQLKNKYREKKRLGDNRWYRFEKT